jgi:hypothetical protein
MKSAIALFFIIISLTTGSQRNDSVQRFTMYGDVRITIDAPLNNIEH